MTIKDAVCGKRILIWGYGREGKASERYIQQFCNAESVEVFEGKIDDINEDKYDLILKSPGIMMDGDRAKYTSQTELFLSQYRDQVIGITGTKGKSTTSSMMAHVLKECTGRKVLLMGNIGLPCMDYCEEITDDTIIVFELSCHQLKHTKVSPYVSVFLNLFEEHLDFYKTLEAYFTAKSHIAMYQRAGDYYYHGENVPYIDSLANERIVTKSEVTLTPLKVFGEHNQLNATFVRAIAKEVYGCSDSDITKSLETFIGLPHRLQNLGIFGGINWYDDSISTIPEAAISAIDSLPEIQTILIGGMDRGISYEILEKYILNNTNIQYICMYESGKRIYSELKEMSDRPIECFNNIYLVDCLDDAVNLAKEITPTGKGCVLSPAAASYGYFKNFEHRGDVFSELVRNN